MTAGPVKMCRFQGMNFGIPMCYGNSWGDFKTLRFVTTQAALFSVLIFITAIARPSGRSSNVHSKQPFLSSRSSQDLKNL